MKIKKQAKWDNCPYALFPFNFPICSYNVKPKEDLSLKDFYHCMKNGQCRKEIEEAKKQRSKEMGLAQILQKGTPDKVHILEIRENQDNHYDLKPEEILALKLSIEKYGQLDNGIVYQEDMDDGKKYTLISGAKRFHAIKLLYEEKKWC